MQMYEQHVNLNNNSLTLFTCNIQLMQKKQTQLGQFTLPARSKAQSFKHQRTLTQSTNYCEMEFSTLSFSMEISHHISNKRIGFDSLMEYITQVLENIYEDDRIGIKQTFKEFVKLSQHQLKPKVQQRLSLLKYLEESLKYKSFSQIDPEIQKEWRKNALLYSISTIWARSILKHQFKKQEEFVKEYQKYRNFIANVSQFYFKGSLKILQSKKVETLSLLYEDTAHQIINNLKDWKEIYENMLLNLIKGEGKVTQKEFLDINLDFNLNELKINHHYLDADRQQNQLKQTTKCIQELSNQYKIHQKINILKKVRAAFLKEITENSQRIAKEKGIKHISMLEKDDILDCMIYCIVMGQIKNIGLRLKALSSLIGNSDLLSKKGVDSYRADLQGAVQYLCSEQLSSPLIIWPKNHNSLSSKLTSYTLI